MLHQHTIQMICHASHGDPFSVLGPHAATAGQASVRCFLPNATQVTVINEQNHKLGQLKERSSGFFEGKVKFAPTEAYRLEVQWADGLQSTLEDPYRFPLVLGDMDVWLLGEGTHLRPFEVLGAHPGTMLGVAGTRFAVWAPNASRVSVVGDFNFWDGRRHPMRLRRECGVWELFLPGVPAGSLYKFEIRT
ncbi:MAG: 1,4-alpha-glucan branching enzyme, partial [Rhodoferax sp.]